MNIISLADLKKKWLINLIWYSRDALHITGVRANAYEKLEVDTKFCGSDYKYNLIH